MKKIVLLIVYGLLIFYKSDAAIFTVTTNSDNAATNGSLRWAITQANLTAAKDTIRFSTALTITPASNYPVISFPLCIDGFTGSGAVQGALGTGTRVMKIIINGSGSTTTYGLQITASNCEIDGIVFQDLYKGIFINGGSNNWIWGCYVGTAANGLSYSAATSCYDDGIALDNNANNNIIGTNGDGTNDANEGNLVAANGDGTTLATPFLGECITLNEGLVGVPGTITTNCTGNRISGNYLGTNETGTAQLFPTPAAGLQRGTGVQINYSTNNIIGTNSDGISDALERNLISGNSDCGIVFIGSSNNKIKGNYIGTTKTGLVGLPNFSDGGTNLAAVQITIRTSSSNNIVGTDGDGVNDNIEGNVIGSATIAAASANSFNYGIFISSASPGTVIAGNYIGLGADGITPLNFKTTGGSFIDKAIYNRNSSNSAVIGTNGDGVSDANEANYIGNAGSGITLDNVTTCVIAGNYIGLGSNKTTSEPFTSNGTEILNSTSCRIGSSASKSLERNYYCNSSQYGVWIDGQASSNNDLNNIRYNTIGMRPDGATAANAVNGIYIYNLSNADTIQYNILSKNGTASAIGANGAIQIGGTGASQQSSFNVISNNTIYKNIGPGIQIQNSSSISNLITQNSIYNNGDASNATAKLKLAIDLNADGVTLNDNIDPDSGPNDLSNFPVISGAIPGGASCSQQLQGTFNGLANTQYYVEVFGSDVCNGDSSGVNYYSSIGNNYGEGKTYLATSSTFTTDASGNGSWSASIPFSSIGGQYITATATQNSGASAKSTSEFSKCYYIIYDCGDAPDTYHTLLSNCGPIHLNLNTNLVIGSAITSDIDGQPSAQANLDADDGLSTLPSLSVKSTSYTLNVPVNNTSGTAATLYGWIDFNVNSSFEATEFASANVPSSGSQTITLTWSSLSCGVNIVPGNSYLRLRLTTDALSDNVATTSIDERSYGAANDGEVEDYKIYIGGVDYGDLSATYPVATAYCLEDTATAKVWAGVTKPSMECTQKFSADAYGDGPEEDGLTTSIGPPGGSYTWVIKLNANQANKTVYYGLWIDWDGNGNFTSGLDAFYSGSAVVNGLTSKSVSVFTPFSVSSGASMRLIVSDAPITIGMYNSTYTNAEVEDFSLLRILSASNNLLTGLRQANANILKWKNYSGLSFNKFTVERSNDNIAWTALGDVTPSAGDNSSTQYLFSDQHPMNEKNYYRLKLISDNNYQYSNIVLITDKGNPSPVIIYPNPAKDIISIQTANSAYYKLQILDITGSVNITQLISSYKTSVDISDLPVGNYIIKFITQSGEEAIQKFVKIK